MDTVHDYVVVSRLDQRRHHRHVEGHLRRPEPARLPAEHFRRELPARDEMLIPILPRYEREDRVKVAHPDGFDVVGLAVVVEDRGDIHETPIPVDDVRRAQLL